MALAAKSFTIAVQLSSEGRMVKTWRVTLNSLSRAAQQFLGAPMEGEDFALDFYGDFSELSAEERNFLTLFKTETWNVADRGENELLIHSPISTLFFQELVRQRALFVTGRQQDYLEFRSDRPPFRLVLDSQTHTLMLAAPADLFYLPTSSEDYFLSGGQYRAALRVLSRQRLGELFTAGKITVELDFQKKLINLAESSGKRLNDILQLPKSLRKETPMDIVLELTEEQAGTFCVTAWYRARNEGSELLCPLDFEAARRQVLFHESLLVSFPSGFIHTAEENQPLYTAVKELTAAVRRNFFEFLNEVNGHIIRTQDTDTLFQRFLPQAAPWAEIRPRGQGKRVLSQGLTRQAAVVVETAQDYQPGNWLEVSFQFQVEDIQLTLEQMKSLLKNGYLDTGTDLVILPEEELQELRALWDSLKFKEKDENTVFLPYYQVARMLKSRLQLTLPERLKELAEHLETASTSKKALPDVAMPLELDGVLRDYQKTGYRWLHFIDRYQFGGILADEMGLGKTLQVLTFLYATRGRGTALIVTPSSLVYNWAGEIRKWMGLSLSCMVIDGPRQKRLEKLKNTAGMDVLITSYPLLSQDMEHYRGMKFTWCVLDEAQHIKNKGAKRTQNVKDINAVCRIAVTGTPIENSVTELWSLFDFCLPGYLGTYEEFRKRYETGLSAVQPEERKKAMEALKRTVKPFILRRTKSAVLKELPEKIEQDIILELTDRQKALYLETLSRVRNTMMTVLENGQVGGNAIDFLAALTRLRQICLHPALVYPELAGEEDLSIKQKALLELLYESIDSGHRVAVFSQFVEMLKLVRHDLKQEGIDYLYLDGHTKNRVELVEHFNKSDIPVFLISLKAGGTGLNLIGADAVILFDPWWNPAVENQAIDRTHRLGQTKTVHVYRLTTRGTIEEKIRSLQKYKHDLFENFVTANQGFIQGMTVEDISQLLSPDALTE